MRGAIYLAGVGMLAFCTGVVAQGQSPAAGTNDICVIPYSHLDLMWGGTLEECLSRGGRITDKAIQIAQRHPEFRFMLEDDVFAASYVETHRGTPELETFKQMVKEGRIELAPTWAGIYMNLPRGEAIVRNCIYGKQYARDMFGVNPQTAVLTDIPGFTEQLPQIFAKSDVPFMVMTRMGPPGCSLFRYRSPDGSSVLTWNTINGYGWGVGLGLHRDTLGETNIARIQRSIAGVQATTRSPIYLGWGVDLFAPNDSLVTNIALLNQRLAPMQFHFSTPAEFFRVASGVATPPEFSGEIPSSWGNLLTSMCALWPPAFRATDTLLTAEKFATISYALGYADYPQKEFESLWKATIESMDHNNFGQGGYIGDERKLEFDTTATMRGGQILRDSLCNIAERVKSPFPRSTPVVVFNPSSWSRDDAVGAHVSVYGDVSPGDIGDYRHAMRLVDETGASVPFYVSQSYGTVSRASEIVFVARSVPSLGYKTYFLVPADKSDEFPNAFQIKMEGPEKRILGEDEMENEFYRVSVDRVTGRVTVFDKELNRAVVKDMEITGTEERGGNSIAIEPVTGRTVINSISRVELEETNAVRAILRIEGSLGGIPVTQKLFLYRGLKRVDVEDTLDWNADKLVRIEQIFPYEHSDAQIRYGIPFGSAAGDDIFPDSGPHSGDEVKRADWLHWRQIQNWIFAGTADWGVTITADGLVMNLDDGVLKAGMLRGTFSTTGFTRDGKPVLIPVPPAGKYTCHYSISSGHGNWAAAKSYRLGMASREPLIPVVAENELSTKSLRPAKSFCSLQADNLVITALKKAERADAVVLRVVEMDGSSAAAPVDFLGHNYSFNPVNLLEEAPRGGVAEHDLKLKPYEISTVRLIAQ